MMNFLSALSFLTVIRTPMQSDWKDERKITYFPLVGVLIGALLCGINHVLLTFASNEIRAAVDLAYLVIITGGLHLDGLADSADGMLSHKSKDRMLEIMKDPHVGSMGIIAVVICLILKYSGLQGIKGDNSWLWLLMAPPLARSSQVLGLVFMDNARGNSALGAHLFQKNNYKALLFCLVSILIPFAINLKIAFLMLGTFALVTASFFVYFQTKIGGMTGDTLGATTELIETSLLIVGGVACMPTLLS